MVDHGRIRGHMGENGNGYGVRQRPVASLVSPAVEDVGEPIESNGGLDIVHEWGVQSFPASDPPANW